VGEAGAEAAVVVEVAVEPAAVVVAAATRD